jgi:hypothetical protein
LTAEEEGLFGAMMKYSAVKGTCFSGIASGRTAGSGVEGARIEFVYDRAGKAVRYWREE